MKRKGNENEGEWNETKGTKIKWWWKDERKRKEKIVSNEDKEITNKK
jgi:hypothetical protein